MRKQNEPQRADEELAAWNMSQFIIQQAGNLISRASMQYLNGDAQASFHTTEEIRTLIHSFLSSAEEKKLDDLGAEICKHNNAIYPLATFLDYNNPDNRVVLLKRLKNEKNLQIQKLNRYRRMINELLGKYGLGMARKSDASKMF